MNIDHTNLLKALKHEPKEPTDAEKIETAHKLPDWLRGKDETK